MNKILKKVESMDETERDHLRQLLNEHNKDSKGSMEWMYKEERPGEEDYLLGRRIDKYIDRDVEKETDNVPRADFNEVMAKRADLDMQSKMREDPLYAIRKKEEEARRRILENPIKMKQLQKAIQLKKGDKKKKKKKNKKHKKKQKKKHDDDSDDSSDSDTDDELMKKYLSILSQKKHASKASDDSTGPHSKAGSSKDYDKKHKHSHKSKQIATESDSDSDPRKGSRPLVKKRKKHKETDSDEGNHLSKKKGSEHLLNKHSPSSSDSEEDVGNQVSDDDDRKFQKKAYGLIVKGNGKSSPRESSAKSSPKHIEEPHSKSPKRSRKSRSNSPNPLSRRSKSPRRQHKRSRSRSPKRWGRRSRSKSPQRGSRRSRSKSPKRSSKHSSVDRGRSRSPRKERKSSPRRELPKKKLSSEEMERRRKEMMEDAKLHDDQRISNVQRYKKEDERESEQLKKQMDKESDFISPLMSDHASQSSVEDRIKRNRYHIQRTRVDIDRPFNK